MATSSQKVIATIASPVPSLISIFIVTDETSLKRPLSPYRRRMWTILLLDTFAFRASLWTISTKLKPSLSFRWMVLVQYE